MTFERPRQAVITRPVGAAGTLPRKLTALGLEPIHLPSLSLSALPSADAARCDLGALSRCHVVIAVSAAAVRFAKRLAPAFKLPAHVRAYALGTTSARALQTICASKVVWPTHASSEALLELPELTAPHGQCIAILAAPGGRPLIAHTLRQRGASVVVLHVYRRRQARWNRHHYRKLAALEHPLVLLTSAEALGSLLALAGPHRARLLEGYAVVSSVRLEQAARAGGFTHVLRASGPDDPALLAACNTMLRTW